MSTVKEYTAFITFGRGALCNRLDDAQWFRFKRAINDLIHDVEGELIQQPILYLPDHCNQVGIWGGEPEESGTVVAFIDEQYLPTIRARLRELCRQFRQEAIGFVAVPGADHLVTPEDE